MSQFVNAFTEAYETLITQVITFIPKLIVAAVIWLVGKYLLKLISGLIKKIKIKGIDWDQRIIDFLLRVVNPVIKIILVLIILDYLGVGQTVIGALTNGLTITIALALGISFGKALEDDAKRLVERARDSFRE